MIRTIFIADTFIYLSLAFAVILVHYCGLNSIQ